MKKMVHQRQESHQVPEAMTPLKALNIVEGRCIRMSIKTAAQARKLFTQEEDRIREETGTHFTKEELLSEQFYDINPNPTIRAVADFFNEKESEGWADCSPIVSRSIRNIREHLSEFEMKRVHPWRGLVELHGTKFSSRREICRIQIITSEVASVLLQPHNQKRSKDLMPWKKRIEWCKKPKDFLMLFQMIGIPEERWRDAFWLTNVAHLSEKDGGIHKKIGNLVRAILQHMQMEHYTDFVEWMDGASEKLPNINEKNAEVKIKGKIAIAISRYVHLHKGIMRLQDAINAAELPILGYAMSKGKKVAVYEKKRVESLPYMERRKKIYIPDENGEVLIGSKKCVRVGSYAKKNGMSFQYLQEKIEQCNLPILGYAKVGHKIVPLYEKNAIQSLPYVRIKIGLEKPGKTQGETIGCLQSSEDFLDWFAEIGVPKSKWQDIDWMRNKSFLPKKQGGIGKKMEWVYRAIIKDIRFSTYKDFLLFMGLSEADIQMIGNPYCEQLKKYNTPQQFRKLFDSFLIQEENWKRVKWMKKNHRLLYEGICHHSKFNGSWRSFLNFMNVDYRGKLASLIRECSTPQDFLKLFADFGVNTDRISEGMYVYNNFRFLYKAIVRCSKFNSWPKFLKFMNVDVPDHWTQIVRKAKNRGDFDRIFSKYKISNLSAHWIQKNGFSGLYSAIVLAKRFGSWSVFLAFMDGRLPAKPIESTEQAKRLIENEIRRLRSEMQWITQLPKKAPIAPQEIETMLSDRYYKKNGVARAVADFYRAQEENSQQ